MSFGWSVGDILAAITFLLDVASALDDAAGSGHDYRNTTTFLSDLSEHALAPLLTCPALDAYPSYAEPIGKQVAAIRGPVSVFMTKVQGLEKDLGVPHKGRARFFKGWKGKLQWHFFTAKEAEKLKKDIEPRIKVVDQLMARLPVSMIHDFKQDMPEIVHKAVSDAWDSHSESIVNEAALEKALDEILARNFERYFGSQRAVVVRPLSQGLPEYALAAETNVSSECTSVEMLRSGVAHLEGRCQSDIIGQWEGDRESIAVHTEVAVALDRWWSDEQAVCLWIQEAPGDGAPSSLTGEMFAMARGAKMSVAAYVCQRLSPVGTAVTQEEMFIGLVYSLIYQLVYNLPADFSGAVDFDPDRIAKLDGTLASLAPAMSLFQYLLSMGSSSILILVENFDHLDPSYDDVGLQGQIKTLLEVLTSPIQVPGRVNKTFFYTSEPSLTLLAELKPECVLEASQPDGLEGSFAFNS